MAKTTKAGDSAQVRRLRESLAREKAKSAALAKSRAEAREQQAASAAILKVISRSPSDAQPVFDAIVKRALRLMRGHSAGVTRLAEGALHLKALTSTNKAGDAALRKAYPRPLTQDSIHGQAIRSRKPYCIPDTEKAPRSLARAKELGRARGYRSVVVVPLLRDGAVIGALSVTRKEPGPFSKHEIDLLKTFADKAVIAIENVRMFNETKEALERQTATADILKVISSSPTDVRPVFDAIARSAVAICDSLGANVFRYDGAQLHFVSGYNTVGEQAALMAKKYPMRPDQSQVAGRAVLSKSVIRIEDALSDAEYDKRFAISGGWRKVLGVPLLREGNPIGAIVVRWAEPGPIPKPQVELLQTFADQAVIAIENVRMFNETKEALERQTATAQVLSVISRSPADIQPVCDIIAELSMKLCGGMFGTMAMLRGDLVHLVSIHGVSRKAVNAIRAIYPLAPSGRTITARSIRDRAPAQIHDVLSDQEYAQKSEARVLGFRSVISVPLLREGKVIGALAAARPQVGAFPAREVELLKTFADQAVIAIENVRLFNETKEALEQQTAISEVLRVISSSPANVQPILEAVAIRAAKICDAPDARIFLAEGDRMRHAAGFGDMPVVVERPPLVRGSAIGRAIIDRATIYIQDIEAETGEDYAVSREIATQAGWRSNLSIPLMCEDRALGAISLRRREVRPFTEKQISLLRTFADQAAIAIENVRLFNETKEALERQTATAEILKVISSSPTDIRPVFDTVAQNAARLCDAPDVVIVMADGQTLQFAASAGPFGRTFEPSFAIPINRDSVAGRVFLERKTIHIDDLAAVTEDEYPVGRALQRRHGHRTMVAVPLLRGDTALGDIVVLRKEVKPFSEKQIALVQTFAAQAVIAIENVRLFNETKEALERQTATAEILKVISGSPTDIQPVFDAIAENAARFCGAVDVLIHTVDGPMMRRRAHIGPIKTVSEARPIVGGTPGEVAILERRTVHVDDMVQALKRGDYPGAREIQKRTGLRTILSVPLMRENAAIGVISMRRQEVRPFTTKEVELAETFAAQAVIAIENVRLFNETKEALEQQTATAEILKVISGSPTEVQPVFDAIAQSAVRLCSAMFGAVFRYDGELVHFAAHHGFSREALDLIQSQFPRRPRGFMRAAIVDREVVNSPDVLADARLANPELVQALGHRSVLAVPMLREGQPIGGVIVFRKEVGPFADAHINLLTTFADQAVIAIENVRLFNETREALEQQTAISEVLRVISSSPADVQPVLEAVAVRAAKICDASDARIALVEGDHIRHAAGFGDLPPTREHVPLTRGAPIGRAIVDRATVYITDIQAETGDDFALARDIAAKSGWRSNLVVPLMRKDRAVGAIALRRRDVRLFTPKQISLLKTFADQAAIAIENVRLFNETKEALERQTATADILGVISSSPTDLKPVFNAILKAALRLCDAHLGILNLREGDLFSGAVQCGGSPEFDAWFIKRGAFKPEYVLGRLLAEKQPVQVEDMREVPAYKENKPITVKMVELGGARTFLVVPLLKDGEVTGNIAIYRSEVRPFTQRQVELVSTFANQAVIAIENVRLFNETKEALERQTATAEVLKVISGSMTDTQPVFDIIAERAARLTGATFGWVFTLDGGLIHASSWFGLNPQAVQVALKMFPMPPSGGSYTARAIRDGQVLNVGDALAETDPDYLTKPVAAAAGYRSVLAVPMFREQHVIGAIVVNRAEPGRFADKEVELLKTFADQAVIAIENVRLFKELEARTTALGKSVEKLTALGEVGQAISSTLDLEKVLKTIATHAVRLTGLDGASIYEYDEASEAFRLQAADNQAPEVLEAIRSSPIRRGDGTVGGVAITLEPIQVPDILDESYRSSRKELLVGAGYRAVLTVPLLGEDHIIGALSVTRKTAGPFADEVVELLKTFATQSAMAIQNARLFREIAEKGKQLEVASQHKSQFLASMSHELRTPLNALLGFNEMILGDVYGAVPADMQPPLAQMQTSGKHLLRLINNVLDLAKIEAGRMELALSDYSVQDTVEAVRSTLRPLAAEKGVELLATVPADIPLAYGDSGRITQCLMNLAGNSLKFTKVGKVEISVAENGKTLTYRVADTGIGIPPDKIESLFTEFKQTDATIASEYGGTGLGLSISKKFVEMHGGRIWVESTPGQGSTFSFEIPLRAGEGKAA